MCRLLERAQPYNPIALWQREQDPALEAGCRFVEELFGEEGWGSLTLRIEKGRVTGARIEYTTRIEKGRVTGARIEYTTPIK